MGESDARIAILSCGNTMIIKAISVANTDEEMFVVIISFTNWNCQKLHCVMSIPIAYSMQSICSRSAFLQGSSLSQINIKHYSRTTSKIRKDARSAIL